MTQWLVLGLHSAGLKGCSRSTPGSADRAAYPFTTSWGRRDGEHLPRQGLAVGQAWSERDQRQNGSEFKSGQRS